MVSHSYRGEMDAVPHGTPQSPTLYDRYSFILELDFLLRGLNSCHRKEDRHSGIFSDHYFFPLAF